MLFESNLGVSTLSGDIILVDFVYKSSTHSITDREMMVDPLVFEMKDFDIVLSMHWLIAYHAIVDCFKKNRKLIDSR